MLHENKTKISGDEALAGIRDILFIYTPDDLHVSLLGRWRAGTTVAYRVTSIASDHRYCIAL